MSFPVAPILNSATTPLAAHQLQLLGVSDQLKDVISPLKIHAVCMKTSRAHAIWTIILSLTSPDFRFCRFLLISLLGTGHVQNAVGASMAQYSTMWEGSSQLCLRRRLSSGVDQCCFYNIPTGQVLCVGAKKPTSGAHYFKFKV